MDPMLDEYLRKKYELDSEDNKDLRRASSESNFYNNIGRGLNTISSSLAGNKVDNSFYDTLDAQSQQALGAAKDDRKMLTDYLLNKYRFQKESDKDALEAKKLSRQENADNETKRHNQKMEEIGADRADSYNKYMDSIIGKNAIKETPGEKALSEATGKEYAQYVAQGGSSSAATHLSNIDSVIEDLKSGKVTTGGVSAMMPDWARAKLDSAGLAAQQKVTDAVMSSLRQIFGAQFTENEGKRVLGTTFDPNLPTDQNIQKLITLKNKLSDMARAKDDSMKYFEANGTMRGYKGVNYAQPDQSQQQSKIKVSNGKETLLIDPSDLPHAEQDGYKAVK